MEGNATVIEGKKKPRTDFGLEVRMNSLRFARNVQVAKRHPKGTRLLRHTSRAKQILCRARIYAFDIPVSIVDQLQLFYAVRYLDLEQIPAPAVHGSRLLAR